MNLWNRISRIAFFISLIFGFTLRISAQHYSPNLLKKKEYYTKVFTPSERKKLAEGEADYLAGIEEMKIADEGFRKAEAYQKMNKKNKQVRYEKKAHKSAQKAYYQHIKSIDRVFRIYATAIKRLPEKNDKKHLDAEAFSIDGREAFMDSKLPFKEAAKASGKKKTDLLKEAFNKKKEAVEYQEKAFELYMSKAGKTNPPVRKDIPQPLEPQSKYRIEKDPNLYISQENKVVEHLDIKQDDRVKLRVAAERRRYANILSKEADEEYAEIAQMRNQAQKAETDFDRKMKLKMAAGIEQILFDKMLRTADLYYQSDSSKYVIYKKYFVALRNAKRTEKTEKYGNSAADFHLEASRKYQNASKNSQKSKIYMAKMNAVQTEQNAIRAMETALLAYPRQNKALQYTPAPVRERSLIPAPKKSSPREDTKKSVQITDIKNIREVKKLSFFVQIGNFSSEKSKLDFPQVKNLFVEKNSGNYKYFAGVFESYEVADEEVKRLKKEGLGGFVVAYAEGKKVSVQTARAGKKKKNTPPAKVKNNSVYFTVQLGIFSKKLNKEQRKVYHKIEKNYPLTERKLPEGKYMYSAGKFKQYNESLRAKKDMQSKGIDGFIVAFKGNQKISAAEARKLTEK